MEAMTPGTFPSTDGEIANLIAQFQADCELRGLASTDDYVRCTREFASFVSERGKDVLNIHKEDLKAFLAKMKEKKLKQRTIDRKLVCLSTFYTFLIDEGHLISNPILPFRRRYLKNIDTKNDGEIRQIISVSDASRLVNSILDTRDRAIVILLLKTGLRRTELTRLMLQISI
jgi:integrase/recombinase XerC